ncbi:MAG: hypothetical protein KF884_02445 [Fimbriimonadaceae bacterium]|nr:hypothetical protein [Fimbriimonadaceae bacterium]QYK58955.1 MAG: hypothetical protein KF884_02445 [Fimbriimonadaceae bacterium]
MGREFLSSYDQDLNLLQVKRVDSGLDKKVVEYFYGTAGIQNGVLTSVTDYLSATLPGQPGCGLGG